MATDWVLTGPELEVLQRTIAERWPVEPAWQPPIHRQPLVAGVFVASIAGLDGHGAAGDRAWAAAALIQGAQLLDSGVVRGKLDAPYVPGLLALREGRLLAEAIGALKRIPDVPLVNASGRDHPRGAGLAVMLGAALEVVSVGVIDRPLIADGPQPGPERGAVAELRLDHELVAYRVRTRTRARPIVVHAGWRVDPWTACSLVLRIDGAGRTPEPLREARRLARTARAADALHEPRMIS